jgi:polyribonucleotide nucleotidyltransferase
VEIMPGKDGLLHISEIEWKRLETVEDAGIKEGDKIKVKLMEIDPKTGKYKLSHRVLEPKPEGYVDRERRQRPERGARQNGGANANRQGGNNNRQGGNRNNHQGRRNDFRDPLAEREPRDFNDSLDHDDF